MNGAATSDHQQRPNLRTREDWLAAVLSGREVTKISQHLALVLYHLADPATGVARRSVRELEMITGWGRSTIADHLAELEVFIRVQLGQGRGKSTFELECSITEAIRQQRLVASQPDATRSAPHIVVASQPDATASADAVVASQPDTKQEPDTAVVANQPDATVVSAVVVNQPDAIPDATPDTTLVASEPDTKPDATVAASQPDAVVANQPDATTSSRARPRATKESPSEISLSSTDSPLPPKAQADSDSGVGEEDRVVVNCVSIKGPNFTIDLRAIDQAAMLAGMPAERARAIAEIYAREWAANNSKPNHPMAYLRKMIAADKNDAAIAEVRLGKANTGGRADGTADAPVDRVERMKRRAAEQLAKQQKGNTP